MWNIDMSYTNSPPVSPERNATAPMPMAPPPDELADELAGGGDDAAGGGVVSCAEAGAARHRKRPPIREDVRRNRGFFIGITSGFMDLRHLATPAQPVSPPGRGRQIRASARLFGAQRLAELLLARDVAGGPSLGGWQPSERGGKRAVDARVERIGRQRRAQGGDSARRVAQRQPGLARDEV